MLFSVSGMPAEIEIQKQLTATRIDLWLREDLLHFRWWLLLVLLIVFIWIWWKMVDKSRLYEIALYAALTMVATMGIDEYGEELTLWDYPIDLLPIYEPFTAINLAVLPLLFSLIYQHFRTWKSFIWAAVAAAAVFCFIYEPLLVWGGFYQLLKWKYYYGFPIYVALAICVRLVVIKILAFVEKSRKMKMNPR